MKQFHHLKKLLVFFSIILLVLTLAACNKDSADPNTQTTLSQETLPIPETDPPPPPDITLVADGIAPYRIIRYEMAPQNEVNAAVAIRTKIGEITGIYPDLDSDWVKLGTERDHTTKEILIGKTKHTESEEALQNLPYGDYIVKQIGNKLVINAWSEAALEEAVSAFCQAITPLSADGTLILPHDFMLTGTAIDVANLIPIYDGGMLEAIYHSGSDNQLFLIGQTDPEEYAAYCQKIEAAGFTRYAENTIADNLFATYVNDKYVINAGYYAYESSARIILEPRTTLPAPASENQYQKITEPSLTMIGLEHNETEDKKYQNGMSFVYQLSDGSYIIIDGGFNRSRDSTELYAYLRKNAPDPQNIVIAAWILTHAHGDHNGCFINLAKSEYASKVKVELVVGNFPSEEARAVLGTEGNTGPNVMNYTKNKFHAEFIKVHVGQKLYIRDAEIEFLYTLESYAPQELTYFNTSSLIFNVNIAGQSFIFYGDASNDAMTITSKMYGDYLKSDFVQASHHGAGTGSSLYGGVVKCYNLSAPTFVLWPSGSRAYSSYHGLARNKPLEDLPTIKEIFVANNRIIRLSLPYTAGTSGADTILK